MLNSLRSTSLFSAKRLSVLDKSFLGVALALILIHLILITLPVDYAAGSQAALASWPVVILIVILGFAGTWLSRRTGFPAMWDAGVSNRERFLLPAVFGLVSGVALYVLINLVVQLPGQIHVPFPTSLLYYTYGAIQTEVLFHLFLIPFFMWLISSLLLKGRREGQVFWGVAIVLSLLEPLAQVGGALGMGVLAGTPAVTIGLMFATIYGVNLVSAYFFRRFGFLAPLTARLSLYLVWHIVVGAVV